MFGDDFKRISLSNNWGEFTNVFGGSRPIAQNLHFQPGIIEKRFLESVSSCLKTNYIIQCTHSIVFPQLNDSIWFFFAIWVC